MTIDFKKYDVAFYEEEQKSSILAALRIVPRVLDYITVASVLDVGCGVGAFLKLFMEAGVKDVIGLDGDYLLAEKQLIPESVFKTYDLSQPLNLDRRYDLVVALEVAEHLYASVSETFVDSLCRHGDTILFSAAVPGQGGTNHVNEQLQSYWAHKFSARGYRAADVIRPLIWDAGEIDYWYRQNTIIYINEAGLARDPKLKAALTEPLPPIIDAIHPVGFLDKVSSVAALRKAEADLGGEVHNLRREVTVLREAENNLIHDLAVLREAEANFLRDIAALRAAEGRFDGEKEALSRQIQVLQENLAQLRSNFTTSEKARIQLEVREDFLRAVEQRSSAEKEALSRQVEALRESLGQTRSDLAASERTRAHLEASDATVRADAERLRAIVDDLRNAETTALAELTSLKVAVAVSETTNRHLEEKVAGLDVARSEAVSAKEALRLKEAELAQLHIHVPVIEAEIEAVKVERARNEESLSRQIDDLRDEVARLDNERQRLTMQADKLEDVRAKLEADHEDLLEEARRLGELVADAEITKSRLADELSDLAEARNAEVEALSRKITDLYSQNDDLQRMLDARTQAEEAWQSHESALAMQDSEVCEAGKAGEQRHLQGLTQAILELQVEICSLSDTIHEKDRELHLVADIQAGYEKVISEVTSRHVSDIRHEQSEAMRLLQFMNTPARPMPAETARIHISKVRYLMSRLVRATLPKRVRELSHLTIINGCPEGESKRYRIENIISALRPMGIRADIFLEGDCQAAQRLLARSDMLLIFRTRYNDAVGDLIQEARRLNVPVVFDVDDLVFEVESVDFIGAVQGLLEEQKVFHRNEVRKFRQTLDLCDAAIATTKFLADRLRNTGIEAFVVPNTINRAQMQIGREYARRFARNSGDAVTLGYFSGSPTHNKDFLEAAAALVRALEENPNLHFHLVGPLVLDSRFDPFRSRIFRHGFMPYLDMLRFMGTMDFVMAPLELDNPFSQGKSELKIFEAAVVQVPCIASATHAYSDVITDRRNGMLCRNSEDWYQAFTLLTQNTRVRHEMGAAAYRQIVPMFDIDERAADIAATYRRAAQAARGDRKAPSRREDIRTIRESDVFDTAWYLDAYDDVKNAKVNPVLHYLLHGAAEGRNPGPDFDTRFYLTTYADVAQARMNPVIHYCRYGRKEGRRPLPVFQSSIGSTMVAAVATTSVSPMIDAAALLQCESPASDKNYDLIILNGCRSGESQRYRVYNIKEVFEEVGKRVLVLDWSNRNEIVQNELWSETVVFFRWPYDEDAEIDRLLKYCRSCGIQTVFDVDDLVFDPALIDQVHGYELLSVEQQAEYRSSLLLHRRMLLACDGATVTTEALARAVRAMGKPAAVVPNGLNAAQLKKADSLLAAAKPTSRRTRVGYFSGSRTHQKDFAIVEPVLLDLMKERQDWEFMLVGELDLAPQWEPFADRVVREGFVPYLDMMDRLYECDINIAPLEVGNAFCEGKSELKYFEAALVEVPSVVSATEIYRSVVRHGETGFVAANEKDWRVALTHLLDDGKRRREMGAHARQHVLSVYSPDRIRDYAMKAYTTLRDSVPSADQWQQLIAEIIDSGLFDEAWYRATYADIGDDAVGHYLNEGAYQGYNPGPEFDTTYYRDVAMDPGSPENPLLHYVREGRHKGISARSPLTEKGNYTVIFVSGDPVSQDVRKRLVHLYQGAGQKGFTSALINICDLSAIRHQKVEADVVVLSRCRYEDENTLGAFLDYAKANNIKVVADFDELMFDVNLICDEAGEGAPDHQAVLIRSAAAYRRMLFAADLVSVTTETLAQHVRALGRPVVVVGSSLYDESFQRFKDEETENVWIALSGPYLRESLSKCEAAVIAVLRSTPKARLRVLGSVELSRAWDVVRDRVDIVPCGEYGLGSELSHCHINLAPVTSSSPQAMAADEIVWLEASARGIPTIASAVPIFEQTIIDGENGYLAASDSDWEKALRVLICDPQKRNAIGGRARQKVRSVYSVSAVTGVMARHFGLTCDPASIEKVPTANCLHIAWVIPGLIIGGGGHRNILRAAYFLNQFGHKVSLYFTHANGSATRLKRLVNEHFYELDCDVYVYDGTIKPADVIFATHWTTVASALKARDKCREIMYFVQDFEPIFTPMGSDYVRAETTYRQGLYCITSGAWCEHFLRRDFGAEADHFRFPVDRTIYYPREVSECRETPQITFFAKPEMPRRCFELGVLALREVNRLRPDIEIVFFGSKHAGQMSYDFPVTVLSLVPTLDDLAMLYSQSTVGLVFSTSNPSLIPYEMMACGLPVVDLDRGSNEVNYDNSRDIALLANPDPEIMAREIIELIDDPKALTSRREKGLKFVDSFPSEIEMARHVESLIMKRMKTKRPTAEKPRVKRGEA